MGTLAEVGMRENCMRTSRQDHSPTMTRIYYVEAIVRSQDRIASFYQENNELTPRLYHIGYCT